MESQRGTFFKLERGCLYGRVMMYTSIISERLCIWRWSLPIPKDFGVGNYHFRLFRWFSMIFDGNHQITQTPSEMARKSVLLYIFIFFSTRHSPDAKVVFFQQLWSRNLMVLTVLESRFVCWSGTFFINVFVDVVYQLTGSS